MAQLLPDRDPFIFTLITVGTMEILAIWIPRSAALAIGVFIARVVDITWVDKSEPRATLTAWLIKTVVLMVISLVLLLIQQRILSWSHN